MRSRRQDEVECAGMESGEMPMKDNGEGTRENQKDQSQL